jgi:hypothetical protein
MESEGSLPHSQEPVPFRILIQIDSLQASTSFLEDPF